MEYLFKSALVGSITAGIVSFIGVNITLNSAESFANKVTRNIINNINKSGFVHSPTIISNSNQSLGSQNSQIIVDTHFDTITTNRNFFEQFKTFGIEIVDSQFDFIPTQTFLSQNFLVPEIMANAGSNNSTDNR